MQLQQQLRIHASYCPVAAFKLRLLKAIAWPQKEQKEEEEDQRLIDVFESQQHISLKRTQWKLRGWDRVERTG